MPTDHGSMYLYLKTLLQLRKHQKDLEYRLHHCLSKFHSSIFLISKPISYLFWLLYGLVFFYLETTGVHQMMVDGQHLRKSHLNFGRKFGFRSQLSYYSSTLQLTSFSFSTLHCFCHNSHAHCGMEHKNLLAKIQLALQAYPHQQYCYHFFIWSFVCLFKQTEVL